MDAAIDLWLLALLITDMSWLDGNRTLHFRFFTIAGLCAYVMTRGSGWHRLAVKYPQSAPYTGQLRRCGTFQMMAVDSDLSVATRFFGGMTRFSGGIMSVGVTRDALYIVAPSVVRFLFPTIQLPWTSIASAKPFEAPGWVEPIGTSQIQAEYDPSFRGEFIELETTAPKNMHPATDVRDRGRAQLFAAELMDASAGQVHLCAGILRGARQAHRARAVAHREWKNVRFTTAGFGAKKPAVSNTKTDGSDDPDGPQKNRRVEIVIGKK